MTNFSSQTSDCVTCALTVVFAQHTLPMRFALGDSSRGASWENVETLIQGFKAGLSWYVWSWVKNKGFNGNIRERAKKKKIIKKIWGKRLGCITGPGEICRGPLEVAAVVAPPSSPVSPAWHCPALSGAPTGVGGNSATSRTTNQPQENPGCPYWAWWGPSRVQWLCPCSGQRHLPGTQTCDSGPSNRRTAAAKIKCK